MLLWLLVPIAWSACDDFATPGTLQGSESLSDALDCLDTWGIDTLYLETDWVSAEVGTIDLDVPVNLYGVDESVLATLPRVLISEAVELRNLRLDANDGILSTLGFGYGARVVDGALVTATNIELANTAGVPLWVSDGDVILVNAFGEGGSGTGWASLPAIAQLGGTLQLSYDPYEPGQCAFDGWTGAGVLRSFGAAEVTVTDCLFEGSTSETGSDWEDVSIGDGEAIGGAIEVRGEGEWTMVTIEGCTFSELEAEEYGGAVGLVDVHAAITGNTFERNSSDIAGGALGVADLDAGAVGTVTLEGNTFLDNQTAYWGGAVYLREVVGTAADDVFQGSTALYGGVLGLEGGELTATNWEVDDAGATLGGVAYVNGADTGGASLTLEGGTFTRLSASVSGGLLQAEDAQVTLTGVAATSAGGTSESGGAIDVAATDLTVNRSDFSGFSVSGQGGVLLAEGGAVDIGTSTFLGSEAAQGAGLYLRDTTATVTTSRFEELDATASGGAVYAEDADLALKSSLLCKLTAPTGAALKVYNAASASGVAVDGVGLVAVEASAGSVLELYADSVSWQNTTLVLSEGAPFYENSGSLGFTNNIVTDGEIGVAGGGTTTGDYNLWFGVADEVLGAKHALPGSGAVLGLDPMLAGADAPCDVNGLRLLRGSPAIDAGDPGLYDDDGSRSDIGAFGGPSSLEDYAAAFGIDTGDTGDSADTGPVDTADTGPVDTALDIDEVRLSNGCGSRNRAWLLLLPLLGWRRRH